MKFLICFVVFASFAVIGRHASAEAPNNVLHEFEYVCKKNEGASDGDFNMINNNKLPETRESKCLLACVLEYRGIIDEDKFDPKTYLEVVDIDIPDDSTLQKVEKIAEECTNVKADDRCELAYEIAKCFAEKSNEYGIYNYLLL